MIKVLQSTIERALYVWLAIMMVLFTIAAFYAIKNNQQLKAEQMIFHQQNVENQKIIVQDVKDYIACLLTLNPQAKTTIEAQEQICFGNAPQVKP